MKFKLLISIIITVIVFCCCEGIKNAEKEAEPYSGWKQFNVPDENFEDFHSPIAGDKYKYLIFGNLQVTRPAEDLSPDLKAYLGRWEGYAVTTPVKNDVKIILFIQEISESGGRAFLCDSNNIQFPYYSEIEFVVVYDNGSPYIKWNADWPAYGATGEIKYTYNHENNELEGEVKIPKFNVLNKIILDRNTSFYIRRNYEQYCSENGITTHTFENKELYSYSCGYMTYLPPGYDDQEGAWPLIIYLCGTGERGNNLYLMPKIGPFQMVRDVSPLPFVIAAPGLLPGFRTFPEEYMDMFLDEILEKYDVDDKRVYVTGLSMGGEAAYRFAMYSPEKIAAIAPLSAANPEYNPPMLGEGFKPYSRQFERLRDIPVWHIHGDSDIIIPLEAAEKTVNDFINAGADVKFTVLKDHDHNVWTDTYLNMEIYDWFLSYVKP